MQKKQIIQAWKDKKYRASLTDEQLNSLPSNPAGIIDISDEDLEIANGGTWTILCTITCISLCYNCPTQGCMSRVFECHPPPIDNVE